MAYLNAIDFPRPLEDPVTNIVLPYILGPYMDLIGSTFSLPSKSAIDKGFKLLDAIFKKLLLIDKENSFSKNHILRFASLALNNKKMNPKNLQMFNFSKKERKELCVLTNQEFEIHNKLIKSDIKKILYSTDR